jgi:SAM-dependent methyltransferase
MQKKREIPVKDNQLYMTSLLRKIIRWNREFSSWFEKKIPLLKCPDLTRPQFKESVSREIEKNSKSRKALKVLEVGSVDRPFLSANGNIEYHGLDIEDITDTEGVYDKYFIQSIEEPLQYKYELIISRMVIEHVPDNHKTWRTIYDALEPTGKTIHIFPGGLHPFSLATRLVGNKMQRILISYLRPNAKHTGYPAYYHLCTPRKLKHELENLGFRDIDISYSYSANDYFKFFFPAYLVVALLNLTLQNLKIGTFASNFYVSAKK